LKEKINFYFYFYLLRPGVWGSVEATAVGLQVVEEEEEEEELFRLRYCRCYCYCNRYFATSSHQDIERRPRPGDDARACSSDAGNALPFGCGAGRTTIGRSL